MLHDHPVGAHVACHEEVEDLTGQLLENFFRETKVISLEFLEGHELDEVAGHLLAECPGVQRLRVSTSIALKSEFPTPTKTIDSGSLEQRTISSIVFSRSLMMPSVSSSNTIAVGQDHQRVVFLVVLRHLDDLAVVIDVAHDLSLRIFEVVVDFELLDEVWVVRIPIELLVTNFPDMLHNK